MLTKVEKGIILGVGKIGYLLAAGVIRATMMRHLVDSVLDIRLGCILKFKGWFAVWFNVRLILLGASEQMRLFDDAYRQDNKWESAHPPFYWVANRYYFLYLGRWIFMFIRIFLVSPL